MALAMAPTSVAVIALLLLVTTLALGAPPHARDLPDDEGPQPQQPPQQPQQPQQPQVDGRRRRAAADDTVRRLLLGQLLHRDLQVAALASTEDEAPEYDDLAVPEDAKGYIVSAPKRRCPAGKQYQGRRCREEWRLQ